jgi:uncharacterized membrane protein YkoI
MRKPTRRTLIASALGGALGVSALAFAATSQADADHDDDLARPLAQTSVIADDRRGDDDARDAREDRHDRGDRHDNGARENRHDDDARDDRHDDARHDDDGRDDDGRNDDGRDDDLLAGPSDAQQAARAALARVPGGHLTEVDLDDDRGGVWEVEVVRDGREYEVVVDARSYAVLHVEQDD